LKLFSFRASSEDSGDALLKELEAARQNDALRSRFIDRYTNYIASVAGRVKGSYIHIENDEEYALALGAFNRALDTYDPDKGASFLAYAGLLIKRELIDFYRRSRREREIPVSQLREDDDPEFEPGRVEDIICRQEEEFNLRQEIGIYKALLEEYSLTFSQLAAASPRHADVRKRMLMVARRLAEDPAARSSIIKKKTLPLKEMEAWSGLSRKTLERHRKYILASFILINSDLVYLRDYIKDCLQSGDQA